MFQRQFRTPLFKSIKIDAKAIQEESEELTDVQAVEVAGLFTAYLTDADAWDFLREFVVAVQERYTE